MKEMILFASNIKNSFLFIFSKRSQNDFMGQHWGAIGQQKEQEEAVFKAYQAQIQQYLTTVRAPTFSRSSNTSLISNGCTSWDCSLAGGR